MSRQSRLLIHAFKITRILAQLSFHPSSIFYHLNTWSPSSFGYKFFQLTRFNPFVLLSLLRGLVIKKFSFFLSTYYAYHNPTEFDAHYQALCLTWLPSGSHLSSLTDTYTKIKISESNDLWIFLCLDSCDTTTLLNNQIILLKVSFFSKIKNYFASSSRSLISVELSHDYSHSLPVLLNYLCQRCVFDFLFMPYEAQPFQQSIIHHSHKYFPNIQTVGYIHSFLPCVPTEYIYRDGCPQYLLINGLFQSNLLINFLGWPQKSIIPIKSLRYNISNSMHVPRAHIYLPYDFVLSNVTYKSLDLSISLLLMFYSVNTPFVIQSHPITGKSKKHIHLISLIEHMIDSQKLFSHKPININKEYSFLRDIEGSRLILVFGNSAILLELLNISCNVLHVTCNPLFDILAPDLWPDITITTISSSIFLYSKKTSSPLYSTLLEPSTLYFNQVLSSI